MISLATHTRVCWNLCYKYFMVLMTLRLYHTVAGGVPSPEDTWNFCFLKLLASIWSHYVYSQGWSSCGVCIATFLVCMSRQNLERMSRPQSTTWSPCFDTVNGMEASLSKRPSRFIQWESSMLMWIHCPKRGISLGAILLISQSVKQEP